MIRLRIAPQLPSPRGARFEDEGMGEQLRIGSAAGLVIELRHQERQQSTIKQTDPNLEGSSSKPAKKSIFSSSHCLFCGHGSGDSALHRSITNEASPQTDEACRQPPRQSV